MARQRCVLGLDVGTYSVKAVELTGTEDNFSVTGVGWERIPGPDMVSETIHAVITNNNLHARRVVTAVSGRSVIVRQVSMASLPPAELQQAIRFEADKYIPYDLDDVQLDCQQLGDEDSATGQARVLLVAAKSQLIDDHISLLQGIGLMPAVIDLDLFAIANAFELCNQNGQLAGEGEAAALVDIGSSKTSICIMRGPNDCFTREVYTAGNALTDMIAKRFGEEAKEVERMKEAPGEVLGNMREAMLPALEELGNEVRLSFEYYENQFDRKVAKVYLSGGSILFPGLPEILGGIFEVDTVRFQPFENLPVTSGDENLIKERGSDLVVALGLAARLKG